VTHLDPWLAALDARHLAELTPSEVARALRALSSCYVERRGKLARGGALDSDGKRAAFALFYAPIHFFTVQAIVDALPGAAGRASRLIDLGCGTGSSGAAWALASRAERIAGFDRHPWAVAEANWTYRQLSLAGHAAQKDVVRVPLAGAAGVDILAAYAVNELAEPSRAALLPRLLDAHRRGARILIVEPIARRLAPWWPHWEREWLDAGGRTDEWRFPARPIPARQRDLARAAGLGLSELTARSLALGFRA
jgi:SAM-dependent methyltransferase